MKLYIYTHINTIGRTCQIRWRCRLKEASVHHTLHILLNLSHQKYYHQIVLNLNPENVVTNFALIISGFR